MLLLRMKNLCLLAAAAAFAVAPALGQSLARRSALASLLPPVAAQRLAGNTGFRLLTATHQYYRNATWQDSTRATYSRFTARNLPLRQVRENTPTRGAALRPLRQQNYQYNAAGKITTDSTIVFNALGVLNAYPSQVVTYTYNAQGLLQQVVQEVRSAGSLRPYGRTTYFYNALNQNTRILDEGYFGSSWLADDQELFTYNALGQVATDEFQLADISGATFSPFANDVFTYNAAGQQLTDIQQLYTNGAYVNNYRTTSTYAALPSGQPAMPQLSSYLVERATGSTWVPYSQNLEFYDPDGNLTQDLAQLYRNGIYANNDRTLYTYQRILATTPAAGLNANLSLTPNPVTSGAATLHYCLPAAASVAVQVFDALGRLVLSQPATVQTVGEHTQILPLPGTAAVYTLRLSAGLQHQTIKLVVE